jgi:hypothetical protein
MWGGGTIMKAGCLDDGWMLRLWVDDEGEWWSDECFGDGFMMSERRR